MSELQRKLGTAALIYAKSMVPARKFRVAYTDLHTITNKYRSFKKLRKRIQITYFSDCSLALRWTASFCLGFYDTSPKSLCILYSYVSLFYNRNVISVTDRRSTYFCIFVVLLTTRVHVYSTFAVILIVLYKIALGKNW